MIFKFFYCFWIVGFGALGALDFLQNSSWILKNIQGRQINQSYILKFENSEFSIQGCNIIFGSVSAKVNPKTQRGIFIFSHTGATRRLCDDSESKIENELLQIFNDFSEYNFVLDSQNLMILNSENMGESESQTFRIQFVRF